MAREPSQHNSFLPARKFRLYILDKISIIRYFRKHSSQYILIPKESQLHPASEDTRFIFPESSKWKKTEEQDTYISSYALKVRKDSKLAHHPQQLKNSESDSANGLDPR